MQAVVATIVSDADDYAREAEAQLIAAGIRVESDLRNEKINYKVREHSLAKVPHLLVVGMREARITSYNVCYTKLLRIAPRHVLLPRSLRLLVPCPARLAKITRPSMPVWSPGLSLTAAARSISYNFV